ncbi:hypothetical protein IMZ48_35935 [Candidatus Bathyarchaeota archaeon]|nr:hypothetical protein [Candidatus Bathyarchaeota archaeon]
MKRLSFALATMVMAAAALDPRADSRAELWPAETPKLGTATSQGCFKYQGSLKDGKEMGVDYVGGGVTRGLCEKYARGEKQPVFAMKGEICYLGEEYPAQDDAVEDSKCNMECPGYPTDACKC